MFVRAVRRIRRRDCLCDLDSDDSSDEDIIEVSNEATIEDMGANKDCINS